MADCVVTDADTAVKMTEDALAFLPDEVGVRSLGTGAGGGRGRETERQRQRPVNE